jgi:multisubunit Na+/H+ antiporter MnhB subunit
VRGLGWALDLLLVVLLLGLVGRIMFTRALFEATVLFIVFGLTLSLAWIRLEAPDIALAEAALGAGVTGALFLTAFQRLARREGSLEEEGEEAPGSSPLQDPGTRDGPRWLTWGVLGGGAFVAAALAAFVRALPEREALLPALVFEHLPDTGVSNPVTGVLLGFRAYDTLLEVGVLVVGMVAVWSLDRGSREFARDPEELREDPVLDTLARFVGPLIVVASVYLLWTGSHAPGGAFQAGALLAGLGVLLAAGGLLRPITSAAPVIRMLGVLGLALFTAVGVAAMPWTGTFLSYPPGMEYGLVLLVEAGITVSIAVILVELFVDVPAVPEVDPSLARVDPTGDPLGRTVSPDGALIRTAEEDR